MISLQLLEKLSIMKQKKVSEVKENEKLNVGPFNIDRELAKIKILIPILELAKMPLYRKKIEKVLNITEGNIGTDTLNLQEERSEIKCGPYMEKRVKQYFLFMSH